VNNLAGAAGLVSLICAANVYNVFGAIYCFWICGGIAMNETIVIPPEAIFPPPRTKWEREFRAFQRLLPELLKTHRGKYVAIHDERVIDSGDDRLELIFRVLPKVGGVSIHVGHVIEGPEPIQRSGLVRVLS
jgi:hypothetical protein